MTQTWTEAQRTSEQAASRAIAEWYDARRQRISNERPARALARMRVYRDELQRYLTEGSDPPALVRLRARHEKLERRLSEAVALEVKRRRVDAVRGLASVQRSENVERLLERVAEKSHAPR